MNCVLYFVSLLEAQKERTPDPGSRGIEIGGNIMGILLTAEAGAAAGGGIVMVVYLVLIFGFLYFFMIRPQKKEQKKMAAMLSSLEVGDCVLTSSGFYGIVIDITDDTLIVEFGNNKNCRIPMQKTAIAQVEKADAE